MNSNEPSLLVEGLVRRVLGDIQQRATTLTHGADELTPLGEPARWREAALARLEQRYGDCAEDVLHLTLVCIHGDVRMSTLLRLSGLNLHPDIVIALAPHALRGSNCINE